MSNITIELRPPPNVDFVHGYPGIPPAGPERPQAAVKGAIEVRVPQTGVKAKWVRVELRKVEVLPPGGEMNTHWDSIGPNPVNLWTSPDEYGVLRTQDFPFSIRIPESIPPSVELDNRAQITYELVASVCTKGKRSFLRKAKSVITTSKAPITIDKHELHSTWPIYNQPEVRHMQQDGLSLMVERNHTCFGPGDRIAVVATVKSDSLHTVILRGLELSLKETTVLRAGPHGARGRTQPHTRTVAVSEGKLMLNHTMYGGQQQQAELSCMLNPKHTTPTLNAARHIDVTYSLMVKAVMGTGENLVMDLPVIVSNWARDVSANAIQQIGPVPNLSNPDTPGGAPAPAIFGVQHTGNPGRPAQASTIPVRGASADAFGNSNNVNMFATAPAAGGVGSGVPKVPLDEFGGFSGGPSATVSTRPVIAPINTGNTARPGSRGNPSRPDDIFAEGAGGSRQQADGGAQWPTAEQEKKLYEQARTRVAAIHGPEAAPPPVQRTASPPAATSSRSGGSFIPSGTAQPKMQQQYPTAEEEKVQLFQKAQAAVLNKQGPTSVGSNQAGGSSHTRNLSSDSKPTGAQLYQQAMAMQARKNPPPTQAMPIQSSPAPPSFGGSSNVPAYRSAEQEKAALRRYEDARQAVDRTHGLAPEGDSSSGSGAGRDSAPISYEALFPGGAAGGGSSSATPVHTLAAAPPPFNPPPTGQAILSEKERLRREYEARDAAAVASQRQQQEPPPPAFSAAPHSASPPPFTPQPPPQSQYASAIAEKEALRRKFEAQDRERAAASAASSMPPPAPLQTPSRNTSAYATPPLSPRAIPATPGAGSHSQQILSAADEKARLKAKYAAEDAVQRGTPPAPLQPRINGNANGVSPSPPPFNAGVPPPLRPRPPVEYIQQTREEDSKGYTNGEGGSRVGLNGNGQLDVKPFTPFNPEFDGLRTPPPPIPPKPAGE